MRKARIIFILAIITLSTIFVQAQSNKYIGYPENDADFVAFIQKNLGKVVTLNLTLSENAMISGGYRGVQPMFDGAKTKGISYSFFIECKGDAYNDETGKYQCAYTRWNENSGKLSGKFRVLKIIKTSLKNYRAVFLAPVK